MKNLLLLPFVAHKTGLLLLNIQGMYRTLQFLHIFNIGMSKFMLAFED